MASDFFAHLEITGDSTNVSVLITCTGFFNCSGDSLSSEYHTSCNVAVLSFPPEYPITHGISLRERQRVQIVLKQWQNMKKCE